MDLYLKNCLETSKLTTKLYSTSFSLGIWLLSRRFRHAIYAIYGFVRVADEIVDTFYEADQKKMLSNFRDETFRAIKEGISTNPILHSFQWVVNYYSIDHELIEAFLKSMEMDLYETEYDEDKYLTYIYGSAEVVGLMCLQVYYHDRRDEYDMLVHPAKMLGRAFQQINFLRDLKDDYHHRGRVYFPGIDFTHLTVADKKEIEKDIEKNLKEAYSGIISLRRGVRLGVYCAYVYYRELFRKIRKTPPGKLLMKRLRINNFHKLRLMVWSAVQLALGIYPRKPASTVQWKVEEINS